MNLLQLKTEVKRAVGRHDAQFDDRIEFAINRAILDWSRAFPWENLRTSGTTTARGGNTLVFPDGVDRVIWVADQTNAASLAAGNRQWDRSDPYTFLKQTQGLAREWEAVGYVPTFTDVSGPVTFHLASDCGSSAVTALIEGSLLLDAAAGDFTDIVGTESMGITNSSGVTTTTTWKSVTSLYLSDAAPTSLQVKCGGNLVAAISKQRREAVYYKVRLHDKPATGTVFQYEGFRRPRTLVQDEDAVPPSIDSNYLIFKAASDIFAQLQQDERARLAWGRAAQIARDFKAVECQFGDWAGQIIPEDLA